MAPYCPTLWPSGIQSPFPLNPKFLLHVLLPLLQTKHLKPQSGGSQGSHKMFLFHFDLWGYFLLHTCQANPRGNVTSRCPQPEFIPSSGSGDSVQFCSAVLLPEAELLTRSFSCTSRWHLEFVELSLPLYSESEPS